LDDAHWATRGTLLLLNYLARTLDTGRVALLTTLRDSECSDELRSIYDESALRPGGLHLRLTGLQPEEVAALAGDTAAGVQLYAQTAGNPLFVRAVLATGDHGATLDAAIRRRVARLAAPVQDFLRLAALAGLEFDLPVVARAQGTPLNDLVHWVEQATRAGLLEDAGTNRCRFAHGLVRDALDHQNGAPRRVMGNRALAEAYEQLLPNDVAALARHWSEAMSDAQTTERAIAALKRAGDTARAASDHDGAARAYRRALDLVGDQRTPAGVHLGYALGRVRLNGGWCNAETEQLLIEAAKSAGRLGLDEIRVDAITQAGLLNAIRGSVSPEAAEAVVELAEHPPADARLAARASALRANLFEWLGDQESGLAAGLEAVVLAEAIGDIRAIGWAHNAVAICLPYDRVSEKVHHLRASLPGRGLGMPESLSAYWVTHLIAALLAAGEVAAMTIQLREATDRADRRRDPLLQHVVTVAEATLALLRGDLAAAEAAADAAERIAPRLEGMDLSGLDGMLRFSIRREQGRLVEIAPAMRVVARLDPAGAWRPGLAAIYAELGMLDEAASEVERLVVGGVIDVPNDLRRPLSISYLADAVTATGDADKAALLYEVMKPWSGLNVAAFCIACYGPVDRYLGMLALTMGKLEQAEADLQDALAQCIAMGTPVYEAHTRYWLARVELRLGDRASARREVASAVALARQVGMAGLLDRLQTMVR
jgi:tetratricopeptide (TPR) repeat protein